MLKVAGLSLLAARPLRVCEPRLGLAAFALRPWWTHRQTSIFGSGLRSMKHAMSLDVIPPSRFHMYLFPSNVNDHSCGQPRAGMVGGSSTHEAPASQRTSSTTEPRLGATYNLPVNSNGTFSSGPYSSNRRLRSFSFTRPVDASLAPEYASGVSVRHSAPG